MKINGEREKRIKENFMNRERFNLECKIIASDTQSLYDIAISRGIQMPHPALGVFSSILCEIEKPNTNRVRLGNKATIETLNTIIGTQINFNHVRKGAICGYVIDAVLNDKEEMEITCVFFKEIYETEWKYAQSLFSKGKLTMSFEISADVESQDKLSDGTRRVNEYYFTGAGLLMGKKPACKNARVMEMAEEFHAKREELIFAEEENKKEKILKSLIRVVEYAKENSNGGKSKMKTDNKDINSDKITPLVPVEANVVPVEANVVPVEANVVPVEANVVPVESEVSNETVREHVQVVQQKTVSTPDASTTETVSQVVTQTTYPSGNVETHILTQDTVETWIWEAVEAIKAEYESKITTLQASLEQKEEEIKNVKIIAEKVIKNKIELNENEFAKDMSDEDLANDEKVAEIKAKKERADKLATIKEELKENEFAKDFSDEDYFNETRVENAKLKKDNAELKKSKEIVCAEQIQANQVSLDTGHDESISEFKTSNPISRVILARRK